MFHENTCASLFFNKLAGLRPATLLKKEALAQVYIEKNVRSQGFFWLVFSRIWTEYESLLCPNEGKYGPEKLQTWGLFTHFYPFHYIYENVILKI